MTMIATHARFNHIVAFEVSKSTLVVHSLPGDRQLTVPNTAQAVRRLLKEEVKRNAHDNLGPLLVVCEATGGYEQCVLDEARLLHLACHRAHGSRVRYFARYLGLMAKTDPIDARLLAHYGLKTDRLRLYQPLSCEEQTLKALMGRRAEIQAMIIAENNRLDHALLPSITRSIKQHVASLQKVFVALEAEIKALIGSHQVFARKAKLMRSVKGVGPVTAATLLANMPELGALSKGEVARLAGLAPMNRDSGKFSGPRHIQAGRATVRRCLYMAALAAIGSNTRLKAFAQNLKCRGKPPMVVITAVMRKLLVILNAVIRDGVPSRVVEFA